MDRLSGGQTLRRKFRIIFSASQGAAHLWTYGEDGLVERATEIADDEMPSLWISAGWYFTDGKIELPLSSSLWADKAVTFALIRHFEGALRPLAQERRRPKSKMPPILANAQPIPQTDEWFARQHQRF